jgi:hypothetical protein
MNDTKSGKNSTLLLNSVQGLIRISTSKTKGTSVICGSLELVEHVVNFMI